MNLIPPSTNGSRGGGQGRRQLGCGGIYGICRFHPNRNIGAPWCMVQLCATPQPRPALALARDLSPYSQNRQMFVVALCVETNASRVRHVCVYSPDENLRVPCFTFGRRRSAANSGYPGNPEISHILDYHYGCFSALPNRSLHGECGRYVAQCTLLENTYPCYTSKVRYGTLYFEYVHIRTAV